MTPPQNIKSVRNQLLKYCTTRFAGMKKIAEKLEISLITVRRVFKKGQVKTPTQKAVLVAALEVLEEARVLFPDIAKKIEEEAKNE